MKLKAALDYGLKELERLQLLEPDEADAYNGAVKEATKELVAGDAVAAARRVRIEFLAPLEAALNARVTVALLTRAVQAKYGERMGRKDRSRWNEIQRRFDAGDAEVDLSAEDAKWLTDVWFDDRVQDNAFDAARARWAEVLDGELDRIRERLKDPKAEISAPPAS